MTKLSYDEAEKMLWNLKDGEALTPEHPDYYKIFDAMIERHKNDEVNDNYDDLLIMFDEMKEHVRNHGSTIIQFDRPFQLRCGYKCTKTGKTWSILIRNLNKAVDYPQTPAAGELISPETKILLIKRCFQTQEGREKLLQALNHCVEIRDPDIEKY